MVAWRQCVCVSKCALAFMIESAASRYVCGLLVGQEHDEVTKPAFPSLGARLGRQVLDVPCANSQGMALD
jgi:hypothetical protein